MAGKVRDDQAVVMREVLADGLPHPSRDTAAVQQEHRRRVNRTIRLDMHL
jgi:hypothetical protein